MSSIRIITDIPGPKSRAWLERRMAAVAAGPAAVLPVFAASGEGAELEDVDGNRFLDFCGGISCLNVGHRPAGVVNRIQAQVRRFLHTCFTVTPYPGYIRVAELLNRHTPGDFVKKTFLVNSGSEAVEQAIRIARGYTGRQGIICFTDAFHGRTFLALSLTSKTAPYKSGFQASAPDVFRIPYAYCYRCPCELRYPECGAACGGQLEDAFLRQVAAGAVAAVILEPVLGEGGFVVPPPEFVARIAETCRRHRILLIADEIQTGLGRTGAWFASQHFGLVPDLVLTGKSLAAGLPLAAVTGRAEVMDALPPGALGGTFGGNPVACEAAIAVLETLERESVPERARDIGRLFADLTRDWPSRFPLIGEIRGQGAMQAIELVEDRQTKAPARRETAAVLQHCHRAGLLVIAAGTYGNVIRLHLPMVAGDGQIREGLEVLACALAAVCQTAQALPQPV